MRTVKNRKRKFALGMKIAAMFSCIAIASVGFAAWIIVNKPANQETAGSITASTVSEKGLTLTAAASSAAIILDAPASANKSGDWLISDVSGVAVESLSVTIPVTYEAIGIGSAEITVNFKAVLTDGSDGASRLAELIGTDAKTNYVNVVVSLWSVNPSTVDMDDDAQVSAYRKDVDTYNYDDEKEDTTFSLSGLNNQEVDGTFWIKIDFGWGAAFEGKNPYTYFNDLDPNHDYALDAEKTNKLAAKNALTAIYEAIYEEGMNTENVTTNDLKYHVTISATSPDFAPAG